MKRKLLFLLSFVLLAGSINAQELSIKVDKKGRVGFADKLGNEVIKCQYESVTPFDKGISIVSKSKKYGMIDATGRIILPLKYTQISAWNDQLYVIKAGKVMGLADVSGKIVLPAKYSMISKLNCYGKALIGLGGKPTTVNKKTYMYGAKYGIINERGSLLVSPNYKGLYEFKFDCTNLKPYHEGKRIEHSNHYITDTLVTDCKYLGFSNSGVTSLECGIIDGKGMLLMKQGKYDYIMEPSNDMVRFFVVGKKDTKIGYYDLNTGKEVAARTIGSPLGKITFWTHGDFIGKLAPYNGETWSFIDKTGNKVKTGFTGIKHSKHLGLWAAEKDKKWEVFDEEGNGLASLTGFDDIFFPSNDDDAEVYVVKKDSKYGAIKRNADVVIPLEYQQALALSHDYVTVKKADKWGILSLDNKVVVPIDFTNLILPDEKNQEHFWISKSDSLYYHYDAVKGTLSNKGFKVANNFVNGLAFVVPKVFTVENSMVNKAQVYKPNADQADIAKVDASQNKNVFGFFLNTNDELVLDKPISTAYVDRAREIISGLGNRKLTDNEAKNLLLDITKENRSYNLNDILGEGEWNY